LTSLGATEDRLKLLLGEAISRSAERGEKVPTDIPTARTALLHAIEDALALISDRAAKTGQAALSGLTGLGVAEVAWAAGVVGMDIAQALGQAEKVTYLYDLFRDFSINAYKSLLALLGQQLAQTAAQQVLRWIDEIKTRIAVSGRCAGSSSAPRQVAAGQRTWFWELMLS